MLRLTFHGAAETVTGSKYLLETDGGRVLIDCGLFQGLKELRLRNWAPLPFQASSLDAIVLTHAHIDHTGFLPVVAREGFRGPIHATGPTAQLVPMMLLDAAMNQEDDAQYANARGFSKHKPAQPLYDRRDSEKAIRLLKPRPTGEWFCVAGPLWMRYREVGHLLGAASIDVEVRLGLRPLRVTFSGDVGRYDAPLYSDPSDPSPCDYLICESTYGDRDHPPENVLDDLERVVKDAIRRGGVMVVASFAVGRAQQLVYLLQTLIRKKRIPEIPIYVDSPMAVDATAIYAGHLATFGTPADDKDLFDGQLSGKNVHFSRSAEESKRLNSVGGPAVIISSSGMMVGGRILHHLRQRLESPKNTIMLGGFMSEGTRGRRLQEGAKFLRIHGRDVPVRAAVVEVSSLSGHAGKSELLRWLGGLPAPRQVFLTHGEKSSAESFAAELRQRHSWNVTVPKQGESVELAV